MADNLEVKEVWVGQRRYVVCHNGEEEIRDRKRREEIIERAREGLKKKAQAFVMPRGLRRFLELRGGELILRTEDHVRGHIVVCFLGTVVSGGK